MNKYSFLITGGSSFLGKAFAKKLSENPYYRVVITSRRDVSLELSGLLNRENVTYLPNIDLTKEEDINDVCREVDSLLPDKFHVINCLGRFPKYDLIENIDIATARSVFDGNILSLYAVAHKIIPIMARRGGGHFIGFTTHTSYQNYPLMAAFTASKQAVESLVKSISNEYLEHRIIANVIALATLRTNVELKMKPNGDHSNWLDTSEVTEIVENLVQCSNNLINGSVIHTYKYSDSYFKQSYYDRVGSGDKKCSK